MLFLILIGVLMIYSSSVGDSDKTNYTLRQLIYAVIGLAIFYLVAVTDFRVFINISNWLYGFLIILLVITFVIGLESRGSVRWIDLKFFTIQASEIAKPVLILFLTNFFLGDTPGKIRNVLISLGAVLIPVIFVFRQPDLGSAMVLSMVWVSLVYLAGIKIRDLLAILTLALLFLPFGLNLLQTYQRERLFSFLNPEADPLGTGYNLVQSIIAVGSGQLFGKGFGRGTQSHLNFLPEQKTDFIFATTAEELGFIGICLILALFAILLWRLIRAGNKSDSRAGSLICYSSAVVIMFQLFINAGMNMGLLPITGITLPFVSFGGSSLLSLMIVIGLVQSVIIHRRPSYDLDRGS